MKPPLVLYGKKILQKMFKIDIFNKIPFFRLLSFQFDDNCNVSQ